MRKVKNWWLPMLLGALLMAALVGAAGARPSDRGQAGALSRRITVPAGHFIPHDDDDLYINVGEYIKSDSDKTTEYFMAPVVFPTGQSVVVESITLYAYDNNQTYEACVDLMRSDPTAADEASMARVCTSGWLGFDPRSFTETNITDNPVKHGKGIYLQLDIHDDNSLRVYGVRIQYHHGTT